MMPDTRCVQPTSNPITQGHAQPYSAGKVPSFSGETQSLPDVASRAGLGEQMSPSQFSSDAQLRSYQNFFHKENSMAAGNTASGGRTRHALLPGVGFTVLLHGAAVHTEGQAADAGCIHADVAAICRRGQRTDLLHLHHR